MTPAGIAGVDLSVTATGVVTVAGVGTITPKEAGDVRLREIVADIVQWCLTDRIEMVVVEGPVLRSQAALSLGMLHGAVRHELMIRAIPYVIVPPATLKKYATGRGNASKPDMAVALYKRAGLELGDDNQVDAWWLRAAGCHAIGHPIVDLPKTQTVALDKIDWPDTVQAVA